MHIQQIKNLLQLTELERYHYFIRYCSDFNEVWGLTIDGEDNWLIFKTSNLGDVFPLWPHKDLALECMFQEHREMGAIPTSIPLEIFLKECVKDMEEDKVYFGVFYDLNREGLCVEASVIRQDFESELLEYE
ncbi:DUF2750 domain-containing protein [Flavobacterium covae]